MKKIITQTLFFLTAMTALAQGSQSKIDELADLIRSGEISDKDMVIMVTQSLKIMTDTLKAQEADNQQILATLAASVDLSKQFAAKNEELLDRITELQLDNDRLRRALGKKSGDTKGGSVLRTAGSGALIKTWAGVDGEITTQPVQLPEPRNGFVVHWEFKGDQPSSTIYIHVTDSRDNRHLATFRGTGNDTNSGFVNNKTPSCHLEISARGEYRVWIEAL